MALKLDDGQWACSICKKSYPQSVKADLCRDAHNIMYIPFTETELNRLMQFMHFGDPSILPEGLYDKISSYARQATRTNNA